MTLADEPIRQGLPRTLLGPATVTETVETSEVCSKPPDDSPLHSSKATSPTIITADDFRGMLARSRFKSRMTDSITLSCVPECRESAAATIGMLEDAIADYQGHGPLPCSLKPDNKLRHDSQVSPVGHPARQPRLARSTVCHGTTPPNYSLETTAYHSMPSLQTWNRMTHIQTPAGGALSPHTASPLPSNMGSKHFSPGQLVSTEDKIAWQYPPSSPQRVYRQRFRSSGTTVPYFSPSRPSNLCVYNIGSPAPVPLRLDIPAPFSPMGPSTLDGLVDSPRDVRRKPQPLPDTFSHSAFLYGFCE